MDSVRLEENARKKPLSYDPTTKEFLYIEDVKKGRKVPLEDLDEDSLKKLVLKRLEISEDYSIESLGALSKQQQMEEIRRETPRGRDIFQAEINYVKDTIREIEKGKLI